MLAVNVEKKLQVEKSKNTTKEQEIILESFKKILAQESDGQKILQRIFGKQGQLSNLHVSQLDSSRIYHINDIKKICIDYRLRFLDSRYFKGAIPTEALEKIKNLEKEHNATLTGYKIIAPAAMFKLTDRDHDPLLFVELGNQYYYLIHKWGNDLHPLRKLLVFPVRSFENLFFTVIGLAFLIATAFPGSLMVDNPAVESTFGLRGIFFFYLFFAFSGLTALYGVSRMKNFTNALWNSKYFS